MVNAQTAYGTDWSTWATPFMQLQQINQATIEKVIREWISFSSDNAAATVKYTQTMQRVSGPEDFFQTQMKLLSQQGEKNLAFLQNLGQIYQEAFKEHYNWTEEKMSSAVKNAGAVVKKAQQATQQQSSQQ